MNQSIIAYLGAQRSMQVIRSLLLSSTPRHLRDLAAECAISPAGVSDILRRLHGVGVLRESREGNRRCFVLELDSAELEFMRQFFAIFERNMLERRAARFSERAAEKLQWMDDAYSFYREVRKLKHDPA